MASKGGELDYFLEADVEARPFVTEYYNRDSSRCPGDPGIHEACFCADVVPTISKKGSRQGVDAVLNHACDDFYRHASRSSLWARSARTNGEPSNKSARVGRFFTFAAEACLACGLVQALLVTELRVGFHTAF